MADITISRTDKGAYEQSLTAGEPVSVLLESVAPYGTVVVTVHDGDAPVYVSRDSGDPKTSSADQVNPGGWATVSVGGYDRGDVTIWLVSASDATVSVSRS